VLDGSFGTRGALPGPDFMITAPMGRQINSNLFQSFSQFNLNSSQSATFTGPSNIHNILSRVTDGNASSIDGTVRSDIPGANLFFVNPAGVIFGQHAHLDVSGSFAVTTANYLKLVGGGRFNANLGGHDTLTSAPVNAFGFLSTAPAAVPVSGSTFYVAPHKSFSVVAGDIPMNGSAITGIGSRVNLVSVKSPGEVQLDASNINSAIDVSQFTALGNINLNLTLIDTSGPGGGPVVIRGGNFYLNNGRISSQTTGSIRGESIDIATSGNVKIMNGGAISADTSGLGNGGNVTVTADSLRIRVMVSSPFIPGNSTSAIKTVGANSVKRASASSALPTPRTSWPHLRSRASYPIRAFSSSSTIRTRSGAGFVVSKRVASAIEFAHSPAYPGAAPRFESTSSARLCQAEISKPAKTVCGLYICPERFK